MLTFWKPNFKLEHVESLLNVSLDKDKLVMGYVWLKTRLLGKVREKPFLKFFRAFLEFSSLKRCLCGI